VPAIGEEEAPELSAERQSASARFFRSEATGSILLLICTIIALTWANSPWSGSYFQLLRTKIGFSWNGSTFALSWGHWINDGLMALFFFVVGLEIKREIVIGELSTLKKAILPVAAAIGGMVLPALIYAALNRGGEGARGWGIPMATDIAFALGILALLGPAVPTGLKIFLTALAIADDLGAVLVIAWFYTDRIWVGPLLAAGVALALIVLASRLNITRPWVYGLLIIGVWLGVLLSGIHATVAGILLALVVPVRGRLRAKRFFAIARERLAELEASNLSGEVTQLSSKQMEIFERLHEATREVVPAGPAFERYLHPLTAYVVLPLFALFNAGVIVDYKIVHALVHPIGLGVLLGLIVGKQVGVTAASWVVIRSGLADMPAGVTWRQIHGAAILSGIGFTMALFVTDLAISDQQLLGFSKIGVLAASALCAAAGYWVLRMALDRASTPSIPG
jgi:NhaA family Na+:H+ antiporter